VAGLGFAVSGASAASGLWESFDGGGTWTQNTSIDSLITADAAAGFTNRGSASDGIFEVHQDPTTPSKWWISWGDNCYSEYSGIATATSNGTTLMTGFTPVDAPSNAGRIGLGVGTGGVAYAASSTCVYNPTTGSLSNSGGTLDEIQRTTDGGTTWSTLPSPGTTTADSDYFNRQGWYDNYAAVDPTNNNNVVSGGVDLLASTNADTSTPSSVTYTDVSNSYATPEGPVHPDQHAAAFTGTPKTLYVGNDGGVWFSSDLGGTGTSSDWTDLNAGLGITQFYNGSALDLSHVLGGAQDNGDPGSFPSEGTQPAFPEYGVGDGTTTAIAAPASGVSTLYMSTFNLQMYTGSSNNPANPNLTLIDPCAVESGSACSEPTALVAPFVMDPANSDRILPAPTGCGRRPTALPPGAP
jgi:hypothetical protein